MRGLKKALAELTPRERGRQATWPCSWEVALHPEAGLIRKSRRSLGRLLPWQVLSAAAPTAAPAVSTAISATAAPVSSTRETDSQQRPAARGLGGGGAIPEQAPTLVERHSNADDHQQCRQPRGAREP